MKTIPIILLSGMAADGCLFENQLAAFPNLRVQKWIPPLPGESLCAYATRLAPHVDCGQPCLVGGASFGGVVALELATHLPALGCILIGSVRSPLALPWRSRLFSPVAIFGPDRLRVLAELSTWIGRWILAKRTLRYLQRLGRPEAAFVRWAICALLRWKPSPATRQVRVFQIHGDADDVFPISLTRPDMVVPGGLHALPIFNPNEVNDFIKSVVQEIAS